MQEKNAENEKLIESDPFPKKRKTLLQPTKINFKKRVIEEIVNQAIEKKEGQVEKNLNEKLKSMLFSASKSINSSSIIKL